MSDLQETTQSYSATLTIELVSDKWVVPILHALRAGQNRHGTMQRAIPDITKKMLTQTLRKLERNGIVERVDFEERPPRVEYFITETGDALIQQLTQMCEWSKAYFEDIEEARTSYDASNDTAWV